MMIPSRVRTTLLNSSSIRSPDLYFYRSIFVASNDKKRTLGPKKDDKRKTINTFLEKESNRRLQEEEAKYKRRLNELKSLTKSVSSMIRRRDEKQAKQEKLDKIPLPSEINSDYEKVYTSLGISEGREPHQSLPEAPGVSQLALAEGSDKSRVTPKVPKNSLVVPQIILPDSINEKLGLSIKFLISKSNQNWEMVLEQINLSGGFEGIPANDIKSFIKAVPPKHLKKILPQLEASLDEAKVEKTSRIIQLFMSGINSGSEVTNAEIKQLEDYCELLKARSRKNNLSREVYTLMIQAYGKNNNMPSINRCLEEMKQLKLQVSPTIISNLLTTTVYKARDHKQAVEVFDSMKFFSESTKPSTKAYQDIIVSYVNNDDIERGLDLYQEMLAEGVPLNQNIMVALARGCSSRQELRFKAWDFMFEIYNNGWTPTLSTFEYMLYLASKDGDLALSRALYLRLIKSQSTSKKSFSFLLLAYSKSNIKKDTGYEPALLNFHEKGRVFRRNILVDSDFASIEIGGIPFLPTQDLVKREQILAESSALWAYTIMNHFEYINNESVTSYLNIASEVGTKEDFIDRFENSTFFDKTGLPGKRIFTDEEPGHQISLHDLEIEEPELIQLKEQADSKPHKSPILKTIENSPDIQSLKYPRTPLMYVIALKTAGKFKDYDFAQRIWTERGLFRKTSRFRNLKLEEKDRLDFQFANTMILALTRMNLLQDALAILISTEYQFKWTWKELTHLHKAAVEVGDDKVCSTVRGIAKRAQLNFAGKIRRKDYKRYLLERGF